MERNQKVGFEENASATSPAQLRAGCERCDNGQCRESRMAFAVYRAYTVRV